MVLLFASTDSTARKALLVLITVVAVGIWGTVLYQLVAPVEPASMPTPEANTSTAGSSNTPDNRFPAFTESVPDVFMPKVQERTPARQSRRVRQRPDPPPALRYQLVGIVNDMAMLHHPNGDVHFARHGDELDGYRITDVQADQLILRHGTVTDTLTVADDNMGQR